MSFTKFIRIFLLGLIIIGVGLLVTQKMWVPKIVEMILKNENNAQSIPTISNTENKSTVTTSTKELTSAITLLSPVKNEVLKEGMNTLIKWNIENLPSNKSDWSLIGSVRCDPAECGKTGLQIFSYSLSDNLSKINWKVISPAEIDKFRGPNKIDYRNYGLDAKSISSSIVVCLVQNGAEGEYAMGFLSGYNFSCSKELPVTIMFNPPLSF